MIPLPAAIQPYGPLILIVLAFVDGLLFGLAIKKAIVSFIIFIVAVILGTYIGISLPGMSASALTAKVASLIAHWISSAPAIFSGVSIFFIIGIAIGIWKG
ncbi:MAG: hypothetical protein RXP97_01675 [Nitrososphaeria archaeon]